MAKREEQEHVNRPTAAFIHYGIQKINDLKNSDSSITITPEMRQQFKKEFDALSENNKAPYVKMFEKEQDAYRNANPKSGTKKKREPKMQTRIQLSKILQIVKKLTGDQNEAVKEIGLGGILNLKITKLEKELLEFLALNYDTDLHCLNVHGHKLVFTPGDVEEILGLKNVGLDVSSSLNSNDEPFIIDGAVGGLISLGLLSDKLLEMASHDKNFKMTFALYILGAFLIPTTRNQISIKYLKVLDPQKINSFNWAKFVFDFLEDGLKRMKKYGNKSPSGCVLILMVKYLDRVGARSQNDSVLPRIGAWNDVEISKRIAHITKAGGFDSVGVELIRDEPQQEDSFSKAILKGVEEVIQPLKETVQILVNERANQAIVGSPTRTLATTPSPEHATSPPLRVLKMPTGYCPLFENL